MSVYFKALRVSDSAASPGAEGLVILHEVRLTLRKAMPEDKRPVRYAVLKVEDGGLEFRCFAGTEAKKYARRNREARRGGLVL